MSRGGKSIKIESRSVVGRAGKKGENGVTAIEYRVLFGSAEMFWN